MVRRWYEQAVQDQSFDMAVLQELHTAAIKIQVILIYNTLVQDRVSDDWCLSSLSAIFHQYCDYQT